MSQQVVVTEQQRNVDHVSHTLSLADGSHWEIFTGNKEASSIVSHLGRMMQLRKTTGAIEPSRYGNRCRLIVKLVEMGGNIVSTIKRDDIFYCTLFPCHYHLGNSPYINLVNLSKIFAREAQANGGFLIHGALAERDGNGVILTAPSGTGKTTASNRLPAPWRSLSDDATLVVRDPQGNYWAHPWPTWSRFHDGGPGGTWDVQNAVPLKGIFFLAQAVEDRAESIGPGQTVSLLVDAMKQATIFMEWGLPKKEIHRLDTERFNNLCTLAKVVPVHILHISLTGAFWEEMEKVL